MTPLRQAADMSPLRQAGIDTARVAAAATAIAAAAAVVVAAAGLRADAREFFGLSLPPADSPLADALPIGLGNMRLALMPLGAAVLLLARPRLSRVTDALLGLVLTFNAALFGAAIGGYGSPLLAALALHGPPEVAGFAVAGAAYLAVRRGRGSWRIVGICAGLAATLLALAAALEVQGGI